ncbi:hypothetical protein CTRI78_v003629 [Colletotrichum trifolii]|uniref:F-box domain-containing protein n=1 Tax=Colletotrichum trifolii TaxID=5466 RepID=A0A4R8RIV2_COLTR|nr:hypothetical protein CTRI78_v003629 [Colletotrichum trifolii]
MSQPGGSPAAMLHLSLLPAEILHHIFSGLEPRDLGRLPRTCRFLNSYVKGNQALYKDVYLNALDTPASADLNWEQEIRDYARLSLLCTSDNVNEKTDELPFVYNTVTRLLRNAASTGETQNEAGTHAASRNAAALARFFREEPARLAFLCRSFIFERARSESGHGSSTTATSSSVTARNSSSSNNRRNLRQPATPTEAHQQSAKLHCLYGRPILNCGRTRSSRVYPYACSKVYDLRHYTQRTKWGPFRDDDSGMVDWEKVEAIMVVLGANIRAQNLTAKVFSNLWERPFAGSWRGSYVPSPQRGVRDLDAEDPYGIAGTWLRIVCFIDYNDFFGYNFPIGNALPRDVPREPLDVGEATRLIVMKIHVTEIQPPGEEDGKDLPVVHFEGISRSIDDSWDENANSDLRVKGTVRLTKEGEVRWITFSIFSGHPRWRSEGIQIGGVGSARGVAGHWFDTDYDPHGPCGPSAYFKVSDRSPNSKGDDQQINFHDFLPIMDFNVDMEGDEEDDEDFVVGEWGEDDDDEELDEEDDREAMALDLAALSSEDVEILDFLTNGHHMIE